METSSASASAATAPLSRPSELPDDAELAMRERCRMRPPQVAAHPRTVVCSAKKVFLGGALPRHHTGFLQQRMHARTHAHSRTHARVRAPTLTHAHTHPHSRTHTHARMHARTRTHARIRAPTLTHARTHARTRTHARIRTPTHAHARAQVRCVRTTHCTCMHIHARRRACRSRRILSRPHRPRPALARRDGRPRSSRAPRRQLRWG